MAGCSLPSTLGLREGTRAKMFPNFQGKRAWVNAITRCFGFRSPRPFPQSVPTKALLPLHVGPRAFPRCERHGVCSPRTRHPTPHALCLPPPTFTPSLSPFRSHWATGDLPAFTQFMLNHVRFLSPLPRAPSPCQAAGGRAGAPEDAGVSRVCLQRTQPGGVHEGGGAVAGSGA